MVVEFKNLIKIRKGVSIDVNKSSDAKDNSHRPTFIQVSLKIIAAGIISLVIISIASMFYFNPPSHHTDKDNVTDFTYDKNAFYAYSIEGLTWGYTNNEGYFNSGDYTPGMEVEVLVMGSSNMEAAQMFKEYSAATLLNTKYGFKSYNVGIAGQPLASCASSLKAAVKKYMPSRYVVIEATKTLMILFITVRPDNRHMIRVLFRLSGEIHI